MKIKLSRFVLRGSRFELETTDTPEIIEPRECPRSYIITFGQGDVRKILPKFYTLGIHHGKPRTKWFEFYGHHDERKKIEFELIP